MRLFLLKFYYRHLQAWRVALSHFARTGKWRPPQRGPFRVGQGRIGVTRLGGP